MNGEAFRALIASVVLVAAPALAATDAPGQAPPSAELVSQTPLSIWESPEGDARHLQSGLRCPLTTGRFNRTKLSTFDAFGRDVACSYSAPDALVSVYLTWASELDAAYELSKEQLLLNPVLKNARELSDGGVDLGGLRWRRAEYVTVDGMRSELWMTSLAGWQLKYRATYGPAAASSVQAQLAALTSQVLDTAGVQLNACAKTSAPERTGRPADDNDESIAAGLMSALVGAARAGDKPAKSAIVFCVEAAVGGKSPMLLWRGVSPDGADAEVDRLTLMTMGTPLVLESARDSLGGLIVAEVRGQPSAARWIATLQEDDRTLIFGAYDGRPAAATLAQLFQDILDEKARPIASYNRDGDRVTVFTSD